VDRLELRVRDRRLGQRRDVAPSQERTQSETSRGTSPSGGGMNSAVRGDTDVADPIQFCHRAEAPTPLAPAPSSVPWMLSSTSGVNGAAPAPISIAAPMARTFPTTFARHRARMYRVEESLGKLPVPTTKPRCATS